MGDILAYYNVPGVQEEFHVFLYNDYSVGIRCDGSREDRIGKGTNKLEAMTLAENHIIKDLARLGSEEGEFGIGNGWLEKYFTEED